MYIFQEVTNNFFKKKEETLFSNLGESVYSMFFHEELNYRKDGS